MIDRDGNILNSLADYVQITVNVAPIRREVFAAMRAAMNASIVPYTDAGIAIVRRAMERS